jgi:protein tyrosine phosphatase
VSEYFRLSARDLKIVAVVSVVLAVLGGMIYRVARHQWPDRFKQQQMLWSTDEKTQKLFQFVVNLGKQNKVKTDGNSLPPIPECNYQTIMDDLEKKTNEFKIEFVKHSLKSCRFSNILCPSDTRVEVPGFSQGEDSTDAIYLHANYVTFEDQKFIATQYPVEEATPLFWMACQQSSLILDLTNKKDKMLLTYYPENINDPLNCGEFNVSLTQVQPIKAIDKTTLYLYHIKGTHDGKVIDFFTSRIHYEAWGDHKGLNEDDLDKILEIIDCLRKEYPNLPVIVHCRAGQGRTGTVIVADALKQLILQKKINPSNLMEETQRLILDGRRQRGPNFVQEADQLGTIHKLGWALLHRKPAS